MFAQTSVHLHASRAEKQFEQHRQKASDSCKLRDPRWLEVQLGDLQIHMEICASIFRRIRSKIQDEIMGNGKTIPRFPHPNTWLTSTVWMKLLHIAKIWLHAQVILYHGYFILLLRSQIVPLCRCCFSFYVKWTSKCKDDLKPHGRKSRIWVSNCFTTSLFFFKKYF